MLAEYAEAAASLRMAEALNATTLIATPETDAKLRRKYMAMGAAAYRAGAGRSVRLHPNSMLCGWWFEGYDEAKTRAEASQRAEP